MLALAVGGVAKRISETLRSFRSVYSNPGLRRLQLAWGGSLVGSWAYVVALAVFAYREHGAYAVGALAVARWVSAGVVSPIAGVIGDRYPRVRVSIASNVLRGAAMAAAGVAVLADASPFLVYGLAVLASLAGTVASPAEAALTPVLARTPEELAAANVSSSSIDSVATFVGPALGGFVLAGAGVEAAFFVGAGLHAYAALMMSGVREGRPAERPAGGGLAREGLAGFRTILGDDRLRLVVGLLAVYTLLDGALDVLIVVLALDTLDLGNSGVGFLNSTAGVGGLVGVVLAAALVGRARLASDIGLGMALWGVPILLIGLWPSKASALVLLAAMGAATTVLAVAGDTLLQRAVPDEVLSRVFGVLDSVMLVAIAVGAGVAPVLVDAFGARVALVAVGAVLPLLAVLTWRRLGAIDAAAVVPERELELVRGHPVFAPLPESTLEFLAARLVQRRVAAGDTIVRQGEPGDDFYLVSDGRVRVTVDGAEVGELGPGEGFGEIALLRDVPRTATVAAVEDTTLHALDRAQFLAAVTRHAESATAAERLAGSRLAAYRPARG